MRSRIAVVLALSVFVPRQSEAQLTGTTLNVGVIRYHFTRTGYAPSVTMRFTYELSPRIQVEPSIGYMLNSGVGYAPTGFNGDPEATVFRSSGIFPEVSITFHRGGLHWAPFASVGLGASVQNSSVVPRSVTAVARAGIRHYFWDQFGLTVGAQYRSLSAYGYTMDATVGLTLLASPLTDAARKRAVFKPSRSPQRFALATGLALPTNVAFGIFPTLRAEWYVTDPDRRVALVADAHVARAFATPIGGRDPLDHRGEYGFALSVVPQLLPRHTVSPYVVWGLRWRKPWEQAEAVYYPANVPAAFRDPAMRTRIEPNMGAGLKLRLPSGQNLRLEMHYYMGLDYFPVTMGFSF